MAGLKQAELGQKIGYSGSQVSRIESGQSGAADSTRRAIARELGIPPAELGLAPDTPSTSEQLRAQHGPTTLTREPTEEVGDEVPLERRGFLVGVAGVVGAGALTHRAAPAAPVNAADAEQSTSPAAELERALYTPRSPSGPVSLASVRKALASARVQFQGGKYGAMADALPPLIEQALLVRSQSSGDAHDHASAALADAYTLASEWGVKLHDDSLAWVFADRAAVTAQDTSSLVSTAEASRQLAIAMRRSGRFDAATARLVTTAHGLGAQRGSAPDALLAVYGTLLLTAAYTQAQKGARSSAYDLLDEARDTARRMGSAAQAGSFSSEFGSPQVEGYAIGIHHALGETGQAIKSVHAMNVRQLPTAERRARYAIDAARAYRGAGMTADCYNALVLAHRHAPEEVLRPSIKAMVTDLLYAPGRAPVGLREFAHRVGAVGS